MRKLSVFRLKSGMIVGRTIVSGSGQVLLKAGTMLSQNMINRLQRLGITAVYVEDGLLPDVEVDDVVSEQTRIRARKVVNDIMVADHSRQKGLRLGKELAAILTNLVEEILTDKAAMVRLADIRTVDDYTFSHSVNVCVLSLLIGKEMNYSKDELFHLGLGAILHDMGKVKVPPDILNKPGSLSRDEFEIVKHHTEDGFRILHKLSDISNAASNVALEHHERLNGEGYPRGLKGLEISRFARVVAVTDVFDALTSDRVYRAAHFTHDALEMLAGSGDFHFDIKVIKAFYRRVAAYPSGSFVALNTGEIGAIIDTPEGQPLRPMIRVMFDTEGAFLAEPFEISLAEKLTLVVARVVPEQEIEQLLNSGKLSSKMI